MTKVKIEAHGHLGDFSEEYFIEAGKEWTTTAQIMRDFFCFVREGWEKRYQDLLKALEELRKIEEQAAK